MLAQMRISLMFQAMSAQILSEKSGSEVCCAVSALKGLGGRRQVERGRERPANGGERG